MYLWDQSEKKDKDGDVFYGREYKQQELNEALQTSTPLAQVSHEDEDGHGTHVAGIAASNGCMGESECVGVAPKADLIVVAFKEGALSLGRSVPAFDALAYIIDRAKGRPVVINISMGSNLDGHTGETFFEQSLDQAFLRIPNIVVVKSAGNEQNRYGHAGGNIIQGQEVVLEFEVYEDKLIDSLEVWYDGSNRISVALKPPKLLEDSLDREQLLGFIPDSNYPDEEEFFQTLAALSYSAG